jgi:NADH-quinone oxidoreductase subunit C
MSPEGNPPEKKPEAPSAGVPEKPAEPAGPDTKPITAPTPPVAKAAPVPKPAAPAEGAPADGETKPIAAKPAVAAKPAAAAGAAKPAVAAVPKPKAPTPVDASAKPIVVAVKEALPGSVVAATEFFGELSIEVEKARIVDVCRYLKETQKFDYLVDLTAVDWKEKAPRFEIVYWLHSFPKNSERLRLRTRTAEGSECPSVCSVWKTANWMEREVFDMFGVRFENHPDLRRILTWDGFQGHPLRKDFPVEGIDTGAAIYPDRFPDGGGPAPDDSNRKVVS